jgi:hypothetical protein
MVDEAYQGYEGHELRSTWVTGSLEALKRRGLFDRYLDALPRAHHQEILSIVAGVWLPVRLAIVHYGACDAMGLSVPEKLELGSEVAAFANRSYVAYVAQVARAAGVTPWVVLEALPKLWQRGWRGGNVRIHKVGPKDARVEIRPWPLARFSYNRVATRGIISGLMKPLSNVVYVTELTRECSRDALIYRVAWA